ncbi:MAG: hypothetical protein KC421_03770 [Anaerolineales bacterium]|nr:hypothetical protein [Anaerolineales bacterium]
MPNSKKEQQKKITTIYVSPTCLQQMNKLAQAFGYYQTRGAGAGKIGSISQLVEAISKGEITLQKTSNVQESPYEV